MKLNKCALRRKDGKEFALYEIKEAKPFRSGVKIRGRAAAGKLVTRLVLQSELGKRKVYHVQE